MTFKLIVNGNVYAPEPLGEQPVLLACGRIAAVGGVQAAGLNCG